VFRRQVYYIASIAFILIGFVCFAVVINQPYIGLTIENVKGQWLVTFADYYGEGYQAGVRVGDIVLNINGDVPGQYHFIKKWNETEGASSIEFIRPGQSTDNFVDLPQSTNWLRTISKIPFVIVGFVFWLLGFMTWLKRPYLVQARALFWVNWIIGLAIILAPGSSRCFLFAMELEYISLSLVPIFLIKLVSYFPKENKNKLNRFSCFIFLIISLFITISIVLQSSGIIHCISSLRKILISTLIIALFLALWNLSLLLKLPKDNPERNQASIIFLGMVIGFFPFVLLTAVPQLFDLQPIRYDYFSSLFLSVIPLSWYYVIVNKYLPDSRRLFGTIISFFIAGIINSFLVTYLLFALKIVQNLNLEIYLAALFSTMFLMVCYGFIQGGISRLLEKSGFLMEKQYFKRRVLKLNESLTTINEEYRILDGMVKSLKIEGALIIIEDSNRGYIKKAVGRFLEKPNEQIKLEQFFRTDQRINLETKKLPDDFPAEIYIPFSSDDFVCGIFIGHRYSQVKFEPDELPLITLIASQLAQRLKISFDIKELSKEIKLLTQISQESQRRSRGLQGITTSLFRNLEKERKFIACEIHDGPLQLGLDLNRWLKYIIEECQTNNETEKAILYMRELVEDLNFELRLISNNLRPPTLSLGFFPAIELMCKEIMLKELLLISLELADIDREERFTEEVELAAYRFLQEGIMNAVKHSGSNKLKIQVAKNESVIELTVSDSGKGFDTSEIDNWSLTGAHFGIIGMKERIESLGGNFQITSAIHRGTMLRASIPIIQT
jgi:two-component system sensor histidine kinase ComP